MTETVYFASDTHFGALTREREQERIQRFLLWLQGLEDECELILLGDIFDFWLDYPTFMPKTHLEILYGLRKLQDRGVRISFVGGNHDIWCAEFLRDELGIPSLPNATVIERQGRRLRLDHGDGILTGDVFYRGFRAAVRNPVLVFLAKSLHPEILNWLASRISDASRKKGRNYGAQLDEAIQSYGRRHDHSDVDYLVIGHIHHPCNTPFDSWRLVCLGDWVQHFTYGRLREGRLEVLPATGSEGRSA
jgi:UDP-2,3-diacylglucosamine hydrolase